MKRFLGDGSGCGGGGPVASRSRRRLLLAAAGGASLFSPLAGIFAQPGGSAALLRAPKQALVFGNSRYPDAPLKNPVNDANGIAAALKSAGFGVTVALESGRSAMLDAIHAYTESLARTKAVGLFYFAGHGAQLAWRNYLIPVGADIGDIQELRERGVDVNALIEGIRKAGNPMNLIILDACRDNPFGSVRRLDQKGLSQLDAPPGTLLAYATAPGNTAIDGEGAHGLYTEYLLKEIQVPEAKVEDVFKRVRLAVRRRSNGLQIPWESTSLEEDFWFIPPKNLSAQAAAENERERRREIELAEKRRAEEAAELKRRQEQQALEARRAAEEAERKRREELALLEQRRIAEEAERRKRQELALKEVQRLADEAERKRREEQALKEARLAEEEAQRRYKEELARREKQLVEEAAERKRREEEAQRENRRIEEAAAKKREEEAAAAAKRGRDPAERQFEEELALWEKIKESTDPGPLEDYLRRYPSGRFSELAQLRLDQVLARLGEKKITIVSSPENPYSKGSARANTAYRVGDTYIYRQFDLLTKVEMNRVRRVVSEITDTEVRYNEGRFVTDLLGNILRQPNGSVWSPSQIEPLEFAVGRRWNTRYHVIPPKGGDTTVDVEMRIVTRENITIPAGTFYAFRVEAHGWQTGANGSGGFINNNLSWKSWYAPDVVRRPVAGEWLHRNQRNQIYRSDRAELIQFHQQ